MNRRVPDPRALLYFEPLGCRVGSPDASVATVDERYGISEVFFQQTLDYGSACSMFFRKFFQLQNFSSVYCLRDGCEVEGYCLAWAWHMAIFLAVDPDFLSTSRTALEADIRKNLEPEQITDEAQEKYDGQHGDGADDSHQRRDDQPSEETAARPHVAAEYEVRSAADE